MSVKLYHNPQSRAVMMHWLLEELGCEYELVRVNYDDGSLRSPEFLALNPMGKIPVLTDGETVVTETTAITLYLADKFKSPVDMAPAIDDPRRGEYLRWVAYQSACIDPAMMQASMKIETNRQSAGWGNVDLVVDTLEDRLSKADPWLFGDWFTAADLLLAAGLGWALQFGLFPPKPGIKAFVKRAQARPAFQKVMSGQE